jgi:hypothetical protein
LVTLGRLRGRAGRRRLSPAIVLAGLLLALPGVTVVRAEPSAQAAAPTAPVVATPTAPSSAPVPATAASATSVPGSQPSAPDRQLVKGAGERIYLLEAGKRRWITSAEIFSRRGLRWDDVRLLADDVLNAIPEGPPLRVGTLVQSTSQEVFLLEGGRQRWVPSAEIFAALGFEWADVQPIRDVDLAGYPPGPPVYVEPLITEPAILDALKLLAGNPKLAFIPAALREHQVPVEFGVLPVDVAAAYQPYSNAITISDPYRRTSAAALAATLAHETMHSIQYWRRPEPTIGGIKCYAWELEAFETEVMVWGELTSPAGKASAKDDAEQSLNRLLQWVRTDNGQFRAALRAAYREECG